MGNKGITQLDVREYLIFINKNEIYFISYRQMGDMDPRKDPRIKYKERVQLDRTREQKLSVRLTVTQRKTHSRYSENKAYQNNIIFFYV